MELPCRRREDVFLPDGTFQGVVERLRRRSEVHDLRIAIVSAFDFRTRMLPYWYADKRMAPCSVRTLADVLSAAGFRHIRVVLQQWTPHFRPSAAMLDDRPLDVLLVSAMQVHAESAYALIRDAHRLGDARPLIIAGGPKAIYEPTDYFALGPKPDVGADCVVTGEAYVLLDLLEALLGQCGAGESPRAAFERARRSGTLRQVHGLVYLSPGAPARQPVAVNTGVQRLLRDLDELPMPDVGYRVLEPPHRGTGLRPYPCPSERIRRHSPICSLLVTQGCRFRCSYCPISAVNQRTWRHKSPRRFAAEIKHIHEEFGIRSFFGTDDNFFNDRDTVVALMTEMAQTTGGGTPLARRIKFYTEATQVDVYRNRDILPLCRKGGLRAIWFGIEDLTATLVKKGQSAQAARELFATLSRIGIQPHVMVIHSDAQPLRSKRGDLSGLLNQTRFVFEAGAVSYQCTYLEPSTGSRDLEPAVKGGSVFGIVGGRAISQRCHDGNHVIASRHDRPWQRQLNILRAYAHFYNPINTLRTLITLQGDSVSPKRFVFQIIGQIGLLLTAPKLWSWARRLRRGPIEFSHGLQPARIPMIDPDTGRELNWAVEHAPSPRLSVPRCAQRTPATAQIEFAVPDLT